MFFDEPALLAIHIPKIVQIADIYASETSANKSIILSSYNDSTLYKRGLLLYSKLIENRGSTLYLDSFKWIPLNNDEVTAFCSAANNLPTLLQNQIELKYQYSSVKLI
jgi:hypothetical protein